MALPKYSVLQIRPAKDSLAGQTAFIEFLSSLKSSLRDGFWERLLGTFETISLEIVNLNQTTFLIISCPERLEHLVKSQIAAQYPTALAKRYADESDPTLPFLLWFHRKRWDDRLVTGRTVWDEMVVRYDRGVAGVDAMAAQWDSLRGRIDDRRHGEVAALLRVQQREARWWRDASIAYFQSLSKRPLPAGHAAPAHPLDWYRAQRFPEAPGI